MSKNIFMTGEVWKTYTMVEKDFLDFIEYVPLTQEHSKVYSIKLSDMLLRLGSYIDTLFKEMLLFDGLDQNSNVNQSKLKKARKRKEEGKISIKNYREIFEPYYKLSERAIVVYDPHHNFVTYPFLQFGKGRSPPWWNKYNRVKHDLYKNMKEATMHRVLHALAGLFLLNTIHVEERLYLLDIGVIRSEAIPYHYLRDHLQSDVDIKTKANQDIIAQSGLFIYPYAGRTWSQL